MAQQLARILLIFAYEIKKLWRKILLRILEHAPIFMMSGLMAQANVLLLMAQSHTLTFVQIVRLSRRFDMELIQSFIYTISRVPLSLYEQRLMLKVVEFAQTRTKGLLMKDNLRALDHDFDNVPVKIHVRDILSEGTTHYDYVESAAYGLSSRVMSYWSPERHAWMTTALIYNVVYERGAGELRFYVSRTLFDVILDFSKGFRKYDLESALSLQSPYAVRLFALMSGQRSPLRMPISELKAMFGVSDKYAQTADFIKKIIEPSRKLLDAQGLDSFTFAREKKGQRVASLLFWPVKRRPETKSQQLAKTAVTMLLSTELNVLLMRSAHFSIKELQPHKQMLEEFAHLPDAVERLQIIVHRAVKNDKPKGYIIGAMRSEVSEYKKDSVVLKS